MEDLYLLTDAEISAGIRVFSSARDDYAEKGKHGMAAMYSAFLCILKAEQIRRKRLFKDLQRELAGESLSTWKYEESPDN